MSTDAVMDHPGYAAAVQRSEELTKALDAHRKTSAHLRMRATRAGELVRDFIGRCAGFQSHLSQAEFDAIAREIIQGEDISKILAARSKKSAAFFASLPLDHEDDRQLLKDFDDMRVTIDLFERAVELQEAEVLTQKQAVIREIAQSLKPKRERSARIVAKALIELRNALRHEELFAMELALQDPKVAELLQPAIFPVHVLNEPGVMRWIAKATELGLVDGGPRKSDAAQVKATA